MIDDIINKLAKVESLLDYKTFLSDWRHNGNLEVLCSMCIYLTFLFFCLSLIEQAFIRREKISFGDLTVRAVIALIIALIFGNTFVYYEITTAYTSLLSGINEFAFKNQLNTFRLDFRYALNTILYCSDQPVDFFNPGFMSASMDIFIMSVAFFFTIISVYFLISIAPVFVILSMLLGPLLIPFSQMSIFEGVSKKWFKFLSASSLMSFFFGAAVMVLNSTKTFTLIAESSSTGSIIALIVYFSMIITFILTIPLIISHLFGFPPLAWVSVIFGAISSLFGLIPVFAKIWTISKQLNRKT